MSKSSLKSSVLSMSLWLTHCNRNRQDTTHIWLFSHHWAHHGESFLGVAQVVADASRRQRVGEAGHLVEDLTLGHHDEQDRNQCEADEGADDVEGVFRWGVITPPGDGAGQAVGLRDVLAPAKQREAGPHRSHEPDGTAHYSDVGSFQPHSCKKEQKHVSELKVLVLSLWKDMWLDIGKYIDSLS